MTSIREWRPPPKAMSLLLPPGMTYTDHTGEECEALGTGIIVLCGAARSGKTTTALALMDWLTTATGAARDLAFIGMPGRFLEALPPHMQKVSCNPDMGELATLRDAVVLLDDTATRLSSRDASSHSNRLINRASGIISHLGLTLILTTQSMASVDVALLRSVELCPLLKRIDPMALRVDRSQWIHELSEAQEVLATVNFDRSFLYSVPDGLLCRFPFPAWLAPDDLEPWRADILSRPFRYMEQKEIDALISRGQKD